MSKRSKKHTSPDRNTAARVAVAGTLLSAVLAPSAAHASSVPPQYLQIIHVGGGDALVNYDFTRLDWNPDFVSFPVNLIFQNAAEIDFVKSKLAEHGFAGAGSTKHGIWRDASRDPTNYYWDDDGGKKSCTFDAINAYVGCPQTAHYRIYADNVDDQMGYNSNWGYWNFATSHMDINEGTPAAAFGDSERSEGYVADAAEKAWAAKYVYRNDVYAWMGNDFNNYGGDSESGASTLQSNGYATTMRVY